MIKNLVLKHKGGYYNYKVHDLKLEKLSNGFSSLKNYLNEMFSNCPNEYFNSGPRSSGLRFVLNNLDLVRIAGHQISDLARQGLKINQDRFKEAHPKVQVFLLENDDKTIAMEIPIWVNPDELNNLTSFKTKSPLTGHIDILRIEDGKIWIWDYKPRAFEEKYAATQIYFYALMLSKRTNISLDNFRCGYFDEKYSYIFKPESSLVNIKPLIEFL
ncbi:MAG: PD-(D/E)XK nuclease family protein [Nanoarchaeota archaeon]